MHKMDANNKKQNSENWPKCDLECDFDPGFWDEVAGFYKFKRQILQKPPKSIRKPVISDWFNGADGRIRTGDLILTNSR